MVYSFYVVYDDFCVWSSFIGFIDIFFIYDERIVFIELIIVVVYYNDVWLMCFNFFLNCIILDCIFSDI